jgi:acetyl esterase/lipase
LFSALIAGVPDNPDVETKDYTTKAEDGHEIVLRWYSKKGASKSQTPAVYYMHGGGMILLSLEHYEPVIKMYVAHTGIPFLSVDYRLCPEVQAPVPLTDCYAGLQWLASHASELSVDTKRIMIMGDSAGGGLAAGLAHYAKKQSGPAIAKQLLIYPMLDDRNLELDPEIAPFLSWTFDDNKTGWGAYLGDGHEKKHVAPELAAARATVEECRGLPPAFIDVGELDAFRDEDLQYARTLGKAGVSVTVNTYAGAPHAFEAFAPEATVSKFAIEQRLKFLQTL